MLKVTGPTAGPPVNERVYTGPYEVYRGYSSTGAVTLERQSLHIVDGHNCICIVETTTVDNSAAAAPVMPAPATSCPT